MPAIDEPPLFVTRKVFLRRLVRRLAASAVAMAALHLLAQTEGGEKPIRSPSAPSSFAREPPAGGPAPTSPASIAEAAGTDPAQPEAMPPDDVRTASAEVRTERLPRSSRSRQAASGFPASKASALAAAPADVLIFDRCLPACDSHDPLLVARRGASTDETLMPDVEPSVETLPISDGANDEGPSKEGGDRPVRSVRAEVRSLAGRGIATIADALPSW